MSSTAHCARWEGGSAGRCSTVAEREFEVACALCISCGWRLLQAGHHVTSARARRPRLDAVFTFTRQLRLEVVCDAEAGFDDHHVTTRDGIYVVGPNGRISLAPREKDHMEHGAER